MLGAGSTPANFRLRRCMSSMKTCCPFFEEQAARIETILLDNGREFCGRAEQHPYELFLQLEEIEHRTTKVRRPQSNGFVEWLHRTLPDEHFCIQGRHKWYESVVELQTDLEGYFRHYNHERPHQGRGMSGRTPYHVFLESIQALRKAPGKNRWKQLKRRQARAALSGEYCLCTNFINSFVSSRKFFCNNKSVDMFD